MAWGSADSPPFRQYVHCQQVDRVVLVRNDSEEVPREHCPSYSEGNTGHGMPGRRVECLAHGTCVDDLGGENHAPYGDPAGGTG